MSQIRSTVALQTIIQWISRSIEEIDPAAEGAGMRRTLMTTWRDALVTVMTDMERRERAVVKAETALSDAGAGERVDVLFACHHALEGGKALQRLATFAVQHATREQMPKVNSDTQIILDAVEALTMGIQRPLQPKQKP